MLKSQARTLKWINKTSSTSCLILLLICEVANKTFPYTLHFFIILSKINFRVLLNNFLILLLRLPISLVIWKSPLICIFDFGLTFFVCLRFPIVLWLRCYVHVLILILYIAVINSLILELFNTHFLKQLLKWIFQHILKVVKLFLTNFTFLLIHRHNNLTFRTFPNSNFLLFFFLWINFRFIIKLIFFKILVFCGKLHCFRFYYTFIF